MYTLAIQSLPHIVTFLRFPFLVVRPIYPSTRLIIPSAKNVCWTLCDTMKLSHVSVWFCNCVLLMCWTSLAHAMVTQPPELTSDTTSVRSNALERIVLVNSTSVPFYHLVYYFTQETMRNQPQVYDLNIAHFLYYTHMYFAWMQVEPSLSVVSQRYTSFGFYSALPYNLFEYLSTIEFTSLHSRLSHVVWLS